MSFSVKSVLGVVVLECATSVTDSSDGDGLFTPEPPTWAVALPVLIAVWVNTHGGVMAGLGLVGITAAAAKSQSAQAAP